MLSSCRQSILTLESTTVISVFLSMQYFTYFTCNPIISSLCDTEHTVHEIHNATSSHKKLFAGEHNHSVFRMLYTDALGIQQYATNSLLFLRIIQDKYISMYRELITQLHTYISAIRMLAKGYLPNTLISPKKLQEILTEVKRSLHITNPDYTLVLDKLHLYYDM